MFELEGGGGVPPAAAFMARRRALKLVPVEVGVVRLRPVTVADVIGVVEPAARGWESPRGDGRAASDELVLPNKDFPGNGRSAPSAVGRLVNQSSLNGSGDCVLPSSELDLRRLETNGLLNICAIIFDQSS